MRRRQSTRLWTVVRTCVAAAGIIPFPACSFTGPDRVELDKLFDAPTAPLSQSGETIVFEEPDRLQVVHGKGCAKMQDGKGAVRVEQSRRLPSYASQATVFLNGLDLHYLDSDHHVHRVAAVVGRIRLLNSVLEWQAAGALEDQNGDDDFEWCYNYTILGWNPAQLRARANHEDGLISNSDGRTGSALQSLPAFVQGFYLGNDQSRRLAARLRRGVGQRSQASPAGICVGRQRAFRAEQARIHDAWSTDSAGTEPFRPRIRQLGWGHNPQGLFIAKRLQRVTARVGDGRRRCGHRAATVHSRASAGHRMPQRAGFSSGPHQ